MSDLQTIEDSIEMAQVKKLRFDQFTFNPDNIRTDVAEHAKKSGLLDQINATGEVLDTIYVFHSDYNLDEKRVVHDGNTRLYCLQQLAQDPEFLARVEKGEASLDLKYEILPKVLCQNPAELIKRSYSLNSTDKRPRPIDTWRNAISPLLQLEMLVKDEEGKPLVPFKTAVERVAAFIGLHTKQIHLLNRVFDKNAHPRILELLEDGVISLDAADSIRKEHLKLVKEGSNLSIDEFLTHCQDFAVTDNKGLLTPSNIAATAQSLILPKADILQQSQSVDAALEGITDDLLPTEAANTDAADNIPNILGDGLQSSNDIDLSDTNSEEVEEETTDENGVEIDSEWWITQYLEFKAFFDTAIADENLGEGSKFILLDLGDKALIQVGKSCKKLTENAKVLLAKKAAKRAENEAKEAAKLLKEQQDVENSLEQPVGVESLDTEEVPQFIDIPDVSTASEDLEANNTESILEKLAPTPTEVDAVINTLEDVEPEFISVI